MNYRITHTTRYIYNEPVTIGHNRIHLKPMNFPGQRCHRFELTVRPEPTTLQEFEDFFGNTVHYFKILPMASCACLPWMISV
ncbi:MAG: hypothetical protein HQL62_10460, partial [Magnetococcales bacterium]|nr:hypothetical protein [Magnetococcales bacterium]